MEDKLRYLIDRLRSNDKPRHVRCQTRKFDNFQRSCVGWTGNIGLAKKKYVGDEPFDMVLIELTPDIKLLLNYIYDKRKGDG